MGGFLVPNHKRQFGQGLREKEKGKCNHQGVDVT